MAAGQHRIEVHKDGYKPYSTTVEVRVGETENINVSLPQGGSGAH
ncbi:MAG: PEGA domain-containing protein [Vicinamibacterales bacterium]